jgi:hypothetical protein
MAESAETASPGRKSGLLGTLLRRALAPLVSAMVHAASAYLGRKAGSLAQEKLLPMLRERGGSDQAAGNGAPESKTADKGEPSRDTQRQDREKRRGQRRKALEQTGST